MNEFSGKELIQAINRGGVSRKILASYDLPVITPEELKVIEFEIRAQGLNACVLGLDHAIRAEHQTQSEILANLNYMTRENGILHSARMHELRGGKGAAQEYFQSVTIRMLTEYARSLATEKQLKAERDEQKLNYQPIKRIADGMRQELSRKQAQATQEAAAARPKRERSLEELEAEARYQVEGGLTDDLPNAQTSARRRAEQDAAGQSRPRVLPAQVTARPPASLQVPTPARAATTPATASAASSNWLTNLQAKAYGVKDGQ